MGDPRLAPPRVEAQPSDCSRRCDRPHRVLCSSCASARRALTARPSARWLEDRSSNRNSGLGKRGPQPDSRTAGNAVAMASFRLGRRLRYVYEPVFLSGAIPVTNDSPSMAPLIPNTVTVPAPGHSVEPTSKTWWVAGLLFCLRAQFDRTNSNPGRYALPSN
jgi:hypothetical protein